MGILVRATAPIVAQDANPEPPVESVPTTQQSAQPTTLDRTRATLHGVVRNAATGEGLPRALVRIEGDANTGVLTDGEGRFEIANLPVGPQAVEVRKPGFHSATVGEGGAVEGEQERIPHNVLIAAEMPDVVFTLSPTGAIRGQVELSSGDAAAGITINLAQRSIQEGRLIWRQAATTRTSSDGSYRFGLLSEGEYAVYSQPSMASDLDGAPGGVGERWGYASVYYADGRDPAGASRIHVSNGQEMQANLTLTLEEFHKVTAAVVYPQRVIAENGQATPSVGIVDSAGRQLLYAAQYDDESRSVHAELPDGSYTLLVTSMRAPTGRASAEGLSTEVLAGAVDMTVAGRDVPNLRVQLSTSRLGGVQLVLHHNSTLPPRAEPIQVTVGRAEGWIDDGMAIGYANGTLPGPLEAGYLRPGNYWVQTHLPQGLCEVAFTSGGVNLAREPVVIGLAGPAAPMELTVRDDCASLQVSLPESTDSITAGEERFFTVFAVPDFDSTADVQSITLRASTGGSAMLNGLAPGNYHVYTFAGAVRLAYRNRDAMAKLRNAGQAITLSPGTTGSLVVEAPQP